jgi:hypothetical protein
MPIRSFFMYPDNDDDEHDDNTGEYDIYDSNLLPSFHYYYTLKVYMGLIWIQIKRLLTILWSLFTIIYSMFGYYLMWITLHYLAVHLYPTYCAPLTIVGFILSPFMVSAPHCIAMRWLVTEGSNVIVTMWVAVGAYAIQRMLRRPNV